jgi:hypothetical protein
MPKPNKNKKGKRQKTDVVAAQTEDDFDDMLAELCAADIASPAANNTTSIAITITPSSSSGSSNRSSSPTLAARASTRRAKAAREIVPEMVIVWACVAGDMSLLRQWAKRGIRVTSAKPLCQAAANDRLDVVRVLVMELGADVS